MNTPDWLPETKPIDKPAEGPQELLRPATDDDPIIQYIRKIRRLMWGEPE